MYVLFKYKTNRTITSGGAITMDMLHQGAELGMSPGERAVTGIP